MFADRISTISRDSLAANKADIAKHYANEYVSEINCKGKSA